MAIAGGLIIRGGTRVFSIENQAGPANSPKYQGRMMAGTPDQSFGEPTRVEIPDSARYNSFIAVAQVPGPTENGTMQLTGRYGTSLSDLLEFGRRGCAIDVQVHMGDCENPSDFNAGWDKVLVFQEAIITNWGTSGDLGTLDSDNNEEVDETSTISASDIYEIVPLTFSERAGTTVENEVITIIVCDAESCGDCEDPSDGCQKVLALQLASGGSPGLLAEIAYSSDGGSTWADTVIDTLAANEEPDDMECVGPNVVVVSEDSISLHWADASELLAGTETWAEVSTGFNAAGGPRAIFSLNPSETKIVGAGGYVYGTDDPTAGVTVEDAGVATTSDLNDVHAASSDVWVAVGAANAVVYTLNGGDTWQSITGPAAATVLNAVFAKTERQWWVGTAAGDLYYTDDQGATWTIKAFPGSGAGVVRDIEFFNDTIGYLAHDTVTPAGRVLRTIDGGNSWYILPEKSGTIPANDRINSVATCDENTLFAAGLADSATDGIIAKAAGA